MSAVIVKGAWRAAEDTDITLETFQQRLKSGDFPAGLTEVGIPF